MAYGDISPAIFLPRLYASNALRDQAFHQGNVKSHLLAAWGIKVDGIIRPFRMPHRDKHLRLDL
jgi:hypothetical protein